MNEIINRLNSIDKNSLSEREFYTEVLKILDSMDPSKELDREEKKVLKETLRNIGCKSADDWRNERIINGESVDEYFNVYAGIKNASVFEAINMISQFFKDDNNSYALKIIRFGTENSKAKEWLERNQIINGPAPDFDELIQSINGIKKNGVKERVFYEEILKKLTSISHYKEFTPDMHSKVVEALKNVGCVDLETWQEERKAQGKDYSYSSYKNSRIGIDTADIATAIEITSDFMKSYDDAVKSSEKVFGDSLLTMDWINNSEEMRQSDLQMYVTMQELSRIDRLQMTEREFYEKVLSVLANNPTTMLSREGHDEIKEILIDIGVEKYEDWKNKEDLSSERIVDNLYKKRNNGSYNGMLDTAVIYVSQMLGDYTTAKMGFDYLRGEGRMEANTWINDSKEVGPKQKTMANIVTKMGVRQKLQKLVNEKTDKSREEVL